MEKVIEVKKEQYQKIGGAFRDMQNLTVNDYFMAGGKSIDHYNSITLKKEVNLDTMTVPDLESLSKYLVKIKRIKEVSGKNKSDLISAIKSV